MQNATEEKLKVFYGKYNAEKLDKKGEIKDVDEVWKKWKGKGNRGKEKGQGKIMKMKQKKGKCKRKKESMAVQQICLEKFSLLQNKFNDVTHSQI